MMRVLYQLVAECQEATKDFFLSFFGPPRVLYRVVESCQVLFPGLDGYPKESSFLDSLRALRGSRLFLPQVLERSRIPARSASWTNLPGRLWIGGSSGVISSPPSSECRMQRQTSGSLRRTGKSP